MCLAIPARIIQIQDRTALIDLDGTQRQTSLLLLDDAQVGDYVIVHAGFAIHRIDEKEAMAALALLREMADLTDLP
ncbi:Hydrogenase assembly chaperone HypC/HupF [uncultured Desulfatiglans sp.]|uniref:Hydrogenase assembly chaperone HypC/HupF n=1 Tax=Uncultured Desulfatiglans sp. TaxID=1748965 RepID=A0A653AHW1_UNCDX|nr:Hydrogenase assembly chaperone HypC/HupF [uncultured Desulfatiglans sp.]